VTRNANKREERPSSDDPTLENSTSAYEGATDVAPASVGPFRAGWEPEPLTARLDKLLGLHSSEMRYEDFLRDPLDGEGI
jgi:hypothetical protein